MTAINQETWDKLGNLPEGDKLVAREALPEITHLLYCALDSGGYRHLLIHLESSEDEFEDEESRGIKVSTKYLNVRGRQPERYLDIECIDINGNSTFDAFGGEIADSLKIGGKTPIEIVARLLKKWRRFWGILLQRIMSKEDQIGLFAELWFLDKWLLPRLGPEAAFAWNGPWAATHDFEWSDKSIEVKATTSPRGRIHTIHGLTQLESPSTRPLYLFSLILHEDIGSIYNIPQLIENCKKQIFGNDEALDKFENAITRVGYSPVHQDEYVKLKLTVIEEVLFRVQDDFPRIVNETFVSGFPSGVEYVQYVININTFNHLIVAHNPDEFPIEH